MFSCLSVPTAARPTLLTGVHFLTSQACFFHVPLRSSVLLLRRVCLFLEYDSNMLLGSRCPAHPLRSCSRHSDNAASTFRDRQTPPFVQKQNPSRAPVRVHKKGFSFSLFTPRAVQRHGKALLGSLFLLLPQRRSLFAAPAHIGACGQNLPPCPLKIGRPFVPPYASLTPRHSTVSKAFAADCGWWLQPPFMPPCASMTPLGQLDATALAANAVVASDRYLPPYASWHGPLLYVPRRSRPHGWWPQPPCPHSSLHRGRIFLATLYHFLVKQLTLLVPF